MKKIRLLTLLSLLLALLLSLSSCLDENPYEIPTTEITTTTDGGGLPLGPITGLPEDAEIPALTKPLLDLSTVPAYNGTPYAPVNGNVPQFTPNQVTAQSYEYYDALDGKGRCGIAVACVGIDLMPTEPRGEISSVTPSGWKNKRYDADLVDGEWVYNRCHLLGFQLTGENANKKNLITGTRYFNVDGMLPFENLIADYVEETENHVLFRVTPIFLGDELVARGVQMEAYSVEDEGDGVCFNVFVYNVQPGITIDYATGENGLDGTYVPPQDGGASGGEVNYVLNTNTKIFHLPTCSSVADILSHNREDYTGDRAALIEDGYTACGRCHP